MPYQPFDFEKLDGGMVTGKHPWQIQDNQSVLALNMEYNHEGELTTRRGVKKLNSTNPSVAVVGTMSNADLRDPFGVRVVGNYAYVTSETAKTLTIIDISDSTNPIVVGSVTLATAPRGLYVSGNYAYVCATTVFHVIDISDKNLPVSVGSISGFTLLTHAYYVSPYVYVTDFTADSLSIIDVTTPTAPTTTGALVDATNLNGAWMVEVAATGNTAWVTAQVGDRLTSVNTTTKAAPVLLGTVTDTNLNNATGLAIDWNANIAYVVAAATVTTFYASLARVDIATPATPVMLTGELENLSTASAATSQVDNVRLLGGKLYISVRLDDAFYVVDASSMAILNRISTTDLNGPSDIAVASSGTTSTIAYVVSKDSSTTDNLSIFNVAPTGTLTMLGTVVAASTDPGDTFVSGTTMFKVTAATDTLVIYDLSDPTTIATLSTTTDATHLNDARGIAVSGNYLFIMEGINGQIFIWDISDLTAPVWRTTFSPGNPASQSLDRMRRDGNYLYLFYRAAAIVDMFRIVDISTPLAPFTVGSYTSTAITGNYPNNGDNGPRVYSGNYVLIPDSSASTIHIIDVTNKAAPVSSTTITGVTSVSAIEISGVYLYALVTGFSLKVYDLTTPSAPVLLQTFVTSLGSVSSMVIGDGFLFASDPSADKIIVFSIDDPDNIVEIAFLTDSTNLDLVSRLFANGDLGYIYALAESAGTDIVVLDANTLRASAQLSRVQNIRLAGAANIFVSGDYAYIAARTDTALTILDISTPSEPIWVGELVKATEFSGIRDVYVSGDYAYVVSDTRDGLAVVDISDPTAPSLTGEVTSGTDLNGASAVTKIGNYAYVASKDGNKLAVVDVTTPTAPTVVATLAHADFTGITNIFGLGTKLYVLGHTTNKFIVVDITNPLAPAVAGTLTDATRFAGADSKVYVEGTTAYVTGPTNDYFSIVNVTTPATPTLTGSITNAALDGATGVWVNTSISKAFVIAGASATKKITVVDTTTPSAPTILASSSAHAAFNGGKDTHVVGAYAFSVGDTNNLFSASLLSGIALPSKITSIVEYRTASVSRIFVTAGTDIYELSSGLWVPITGTLSLTSGARWRWEMFDDLLIGVNSEGDPPVVFDGTGNFETLSDDAPQAPKWIEVWNSRLFLATDDTVFYSALGDPTDWTGATSGSFEIDILDGDIVNGIKAHKGFLFTWKRNKVYRLQTGVPNTDETQWSNEVVIVNLGCIGGDTIQQVLDDVLFLSASGVASLGASLEAGDFKAATPSASIAELAGLSQAVDTYPAIVDDANSQYIISYSSVDGDNDTSFVMDFKKVKDGLIRWTKFAGLIVGNAYAQGYVDSERVLLIGGSNDLYRRKTADDSTPYSDATSTAYTKTWRGKQLTLGAPLRRKDFSRWGLWLEGLAANLTVDLGIRFDGASSDTYTTSLALSANSPGLIELTQKIFGTAGRRALSIQLGITNATAEEAFTINAFMIEAMQLTMRQVSDSL
jgi:hypothetical protein